MSWQCYVVEYVGQSEPEPLEDGGTLTHSIWKLPGIEGNLYWKDLQPGAMWFEEGELIVKIPGSSYGSNWNLDRGRLLNAQNAQWTRTGEPPNITVSPSINWVGHYHGWLKDGMLTDDCEGRIL